MKNKIEEFSNIKFEIEELLPAIRASITKILIKKYKLKEERVAVMLGLTQAAISKYLNNDYSKKVKNIESKFNKNMVNELVKNIIEGRKNKANTIVCKICKKSYLYSKRI